MSSFYRPTLNPYTGEYEIALWLDNYFGHHHYGVIFTNGDVVDPDKIKLTTREPTSEESETIKIKINCLVEDVKIQQVEEPSPIKEIEKFCDDLKSKLIAKFEKGAKEHGDGWREVAFTSSEVSTLSTLNFIFYPFKIKVLYMVYNFLVVKSASIFQMHYEHHPTHN